ncbi:MAG: 16S rRNA (cytosine(967)-C(5))-methyltransferase RsmB [Clostridia bacterium]|nr:16S rRNA (cytosine(967)-C(5))-methyltransferase RsmB [Clostridia bacterium]
MEDKARRFALTVLRRVWEQGAYSNIEIINTLKRTELSTIDKAFGVALVNGAAERLLTLDFMIERASGRKCADIEKELLAVLRLGFLQLFYMKVPDMAACSESVALVSGKKRKGFVNAVMRSACRGRSALEAAVEAAEDSVKYSLSPEICDLVAAQYPDESDAVMAAFFDHNPLILRVNTLKNTAEKLLELLTAAGVEGTVLGKAVAVQSGSSAGLAAVDMGDAFVQGLSSQAAVSALGAQAGHRVIDMCACPGGKTLGAALDMENTGSILAMDIHGNKLPLIKRSAETLGVDIIETREQDGRKYDPTLAESADRVICDVPCSGIGAIKGRPEIRYKSFSDIDRLIDTQRAILKNAYCYLKKGGRMVYSTCTVNKNENEGVVHPFLTESGAVLVSERTVLPLEKWHDGFYIAVLEKRI